MQIFIYCKVTPHVSGVTAPIIRSTKNWPRWREVAVPVLWLVPEAAVTVFSTPDDGWCDTRNMESDSAVNKYLHTVVSGWIFINNEVTLSRAASWCTFVIIRSVRCFLYIERYIKKLGHFTVKHKSLFFVPHFLPASCSFLALNRNSALLNDTRRNYLHSLFLSCRVFMSCESVALGFYFSSYNQQLINTEIQKAGSSCAEQNGSPAGAAHTHLRRRILYCTVSPSEKGSTSAKRWR